MKLLLAALLLAASSSARAAELVPVVEVSALAGQLFQDGKASAWQGNAQLHATPAVKFSERWGLIPTYAAGYQGTKSAVELAGGGQLFEDSQSHTLSVKAVCKLDSLKLKASAGYRWELLRETRDEDWGEGLFDYRKPSAGFEAEYVFTDKIKASAAFDYYEIRFPNYASLAGKSPAALGREQAESRTLDTRNYSWTVSGSFPLPFEGGRAQVTGNVTDRNHPDQHVVDSAGTLTAQLRADDIKSGAGTLSYARVFSEKLASVLSFTLSEVRYRSSQDHYDADQNVFSEGYYSYDERTLSPRLTVLLGAKRAELSAAYLLIQRDYLGRTAQDVSGGYLGKAVALSQDSYLLDFSIPIGWGLKLLAKTVFTNSSSNMRYEKTFRYNYTLSSHLVGLSYRY